MLTIVNILYDASIRAHVEALTIASDGKRAEWVACAGKIYITLKY